MDDAKEKVDKIAKFIENYFQWSQERGKMYGSIEVLESNWCLLNSIYLIMHGLEEEGNKYSFQEFLFQKGFSAKSASTAIKEETVKDPYMKLNQIWKEYIEWRDSNILKR